MTKAYSTLKVKAVTDNGDERIITGIASTPTPDRDDDIIEPSGAKFALPIPLLWQHNHNQPIGEVTEAKITDAGIEITAKIAKIDEDGTLKDRIDEAWQSIKSGLVKCLSVGFRTLEYNYIDSTWGLHIKEWEWYELSAVTIPANSDAVITSVKDFKKAFADGASKALALGSEASKTPSQTDATKTAPVGVTTEPKNAVALTANDSYVKLTDPNQGAVELLC